MQTARSRNRANVAIFSWIINRIYSSLRNQSILFLIVVNVTAEGSWADFEVVSLAV